LAIYGWAPVKSDPAGNPKLTTKLVKEYNPRPLLDMVGLANI
jgi:hypothetical protein